MKKRFISPRARRKPTLTRRSKTSIRINTLPKEIPWSFFKIRLIFLSLIRWSIKRGPEPRPLKVSQKHPMIIKTMPAEKRYQGQAIIEGLFKTACHGTGDDLTVSQGGWTCLNERCRVPQYLKSKLTPGPSEEPGRNSIVRSSSCV